MTPPATPVLLASPPRSRPVLEPVSHLALGVAPEPVEVKRVRTAVARALREWGLGDQADAVLLVVSELVTNAVRHAPCPEIGFRAVHTQGALLIEVEDGTGSAPVLPRHHDDSAEHGRGLALVEALADDWGWTPHPSGTKTTWALLTVAPDDR